MSKNKAVRQMEDAYAVAAGRIRACTRDLKRSPGDAEALHQYRISLRVARSLVKFGAPYMKRPYAKELASVLKALQAPTSSVREHDMLVKQLAQLDAEVPAQVTEAAMSRQRDIRANFLEVFDSRETRKQLKKARKLLGDVKWKKRICKDGLAAYKVVERVSAERMSCEDGLAHVDPNDREMVHDLRKRAKALRYVTRELSAILPEGSLRTSADMKAVQDLLGDMLDARVNAQLLRELCGEAAAPVAELFEQRAENILAGL